MKFTAKSDGRNTLNLRQIVEDYANNLWIPDFYSEERAIGFVLDHFRRAFGSEMEMLVVECEKEDEVVA